MNRKNLNDSKRNEISQNRETSLIRIDDELKDKVRIQAMKNKVTMKEYIEYLILRDDNSNNNFENSKDSKSEEADQDIDSKKIKIEIEGHIYIRQ
ncbi:hypothetical protein HYQ40_10415 [Aerococcaceae bacterium DSM 111021]|nr:hypothetical protein [Aerococcaceae bacterium DSM 111021]